MSYMRVLRWLRRNDAARCWHDQEPDSGKSMLMPCAVAQGLVARTCSYNCATILSGCDPLHCATQIH
jgi:hypothetical protein